ncbi:TIM barrel protein [Actinosynnema sp. NPDC020468]|uniref:sugar phosphate isomerase/epimerase family protein n=1 Tax=Actinosynnema sp. NPDC020468 TaxID=3154488 RepID=UPI0033C3C802
MIISVHGIAAASWDLADELALYPETGADAFGLAAAKVAGGLPEAPLPPAYLVHPFTADPTDDAGWDAQCAALVDAIDLGPPLVYVTSGPSGALRWEEAADRFVERLTPVVAHARAAGVGLAIENTLSVRCDLSFTHSVRDAAAVADRLGIGLCVDLYCCWQESGLRDTLAAHLDRIALVQVSDFKPGTLTFPNRWVPGDGDLPLDRLLADVLALGYDGVVDVELTGPAIDAEGPRSALTRAVAWTAARVR